MKIHSSTGTLFSYHFCILLPSHEWHWGFCRQFSLFFVVVIFFLNCTFRILAYVNILTTNIFCSPRSPSDAVWVWEELGTSCEGCRHRMSALCLSCLDPTAASYPATVESHPSRPPFLQGFFCSVPIRNKCFICQFIEEWFLTFPSVSCRFRFWFNQYTTRFRHSAIWSFIFIFR